jgi:hypothetical protein
MFNRKNLTVREFNLLRESVKLQMEHNEKLTRKAAEKLVLQHHCSLYNIARLIRLGK